MTDTITRYVFETKALSVFEEETSTIVRDGKDGQGNTKWKTETKKTGVWYIRIDGSSAICLGNEKPDIAVGDTVKITLEKVGRNEGQNERN